MYQLKLIVSILVRDKNPLWLYILLIRFIVDRMTSCILIGIYLAVMNSGLFGIVIMNYTLFTNMISIDRVISVYISFISGVIATLVTTSTGDIVLILFPFRYPKLGTNIYSSYMMSSLVTGKFGSRFTFTIIG